MDEYILDILCKYDGFGYVWQSKRMVGVRSDILWYDDC